MGSVDRGLIRLAGSRCPMSSDRSPSIRRSTDDAITRLHPRKSCVLKSCFSVRSASRFSVPTWFRSGAARSRSQDWPKATAAGVRAAVLTAVSTAPGSFRSGARLIVPPVAVVLLAHHHRPGDACHLVGERTGDELALLGFEQFGQPGILFGAPAAQHRHCAIDQQPAQIAIAALADRTELDLPPVPSCRGTRPSDAAKCRALVKAAGSITIAAIAVDRIGPQPGMVIR